MEFRRTNQVLRKGSAFFAAAELDRLTRCGAPATMRTALVLDAAEQALNERVLDGHLVSSTRTVARHAAVHRPLSRGWRGAVGRERWRCV
jgi:hypothetical protein